MRTLTDVYGVGEVAGSRGGVWADADDDLTVSQANQQNPRTGSGPRLSIPTLIFLTEHERALRGMAWHERRHSGFTSGLSRSIDLLDLMREAPR